MSDEDDLTIRGENISFSFKSGLAKDSFVAGLVKMVEKNKKVKEGNLTCGQCAVYPCFRHYTSSTGAGLCYQEVRECRQECDNFIQDIESGKAPLFIITGTCRKDNSKVIYDTPCKYEIEKRE